MWGLGFSLLPPRQVVPLLWASAGNLKWHGPGVRRPAVVTEKWAHQHMPQVLFRHAPVIMKSRWRTEEELNQKTSHQVRGWGFPHGIGSNCAQFYYPLNHHRAPGWAHTPQIPPLTNTMMSGKWDIYPEDEEIGICKQDLTNKVSRDSGKNCLDGWATEILSLCHLRDQCPCLLGLLSGKLKF